MYVNLDFETDLYLDLGFNIDHNLGHHVDNDIDIDIHVNLVLDLNFGLDLNLDLDLDPDWFPQYVLELDLNIVCSVKSKWSSEKLWPGGWLVEFWLMIAQAQLQPIHKFGANFGYPPFHPSQATYQALQSPVCYTLSLIADLNRGSKSSK